MRKIKEVYRKIERIITALVEKWAFHYYKQMRRKKSFVHSCKAIHVKKGKRRYTILLVETSNGLLKYNLGRHEAKYLPEYTFKV